MIVDNLNTHYFASLVEYIANANAIDYEGERGEKGKYGILKNKETRISFIKQLHWVIKPSGNKILNNNCEKQY